MLKLWPGRLNAEISAWHIKLNTMKLRAEEKKIAVLLCTVTQQSSKFLFLKQSKTWKQAVRLFIEYGTVTRLEERTEHCMPALSPTQAITKTICAPAVAY